ncbi:unnamed protein product, partial [Rotaria magnacalcarata]
MADSQQEDEGRPQGQGESGVYVEDHIPELQNIIGGQYLLESTPNFNEFGDEIRTNNPNYVMQGPPTGQQTTSDGERFYFSKKDYINILKDRVRLANLQSDIDLGILTRTGTKPNNNINPPSNLNTSRPSQVYQSNSTGTNSTVSSNTTVPHNNQTNTGPSVRTKTNDLNNLTGNTTNSNINPTQIPSYAQAVGMQIPQSQPNIQANSQTYAQPNIRVPHIQPHMPNVAQNQSTFTMPAHINSGLNQSHQYPSNQNFSQPYIITNDKNPPELAVFRNNTLDHFNKYIEYFENYCVKNYANNREQWASMLINKMSKEIKATLPNEAEFEWTYDEVVSNIQDYIKLVGDKDESSLTSKFWSTTKDPKDSVTLFGSKLLQAFKAAFPHERHTYATNKQLKEKYLHCLAEDTQHWVKSNTMVHTSTGQILFYETYVDLAGKYENEIKPRQQRLERAPQAAAAPKYYPNQYKNVQYNKLTQGPEPLPDLSSDIDNQFISELEACNVNVPLPTVQQPIAEPVNYYQPQGFNNYNYVTTTTPPGSVPMQHLQAQQEVVKKDSPPVKNTPPG